MTLPASDFIRTTISEDLKNKKNLGRLVTRFPPEPNGYLHVGHAKSICLNFGVASEHNGGICNLRFDDTNPTKESVEYVDSIKEDVHWLGFECGDRVFYASDYFDQLYEYALDLIKKNKAYVDSLNGEEIRIYRGTLTAPGKASPHRNRSLEENLDLFKRMRDGDFEEGAHVLRAKIDMASPNLNMRDPILYRIRKTPHHRMGSRWNIYPMYDFTHCLSDSIEGITHSLCTLEFQDHRPLYDWVLDAVGTSNHPQQIEFARLNLSYTVMSKRLLSELVSSGIVAGWDDPRLPTIKGMRRRGYTAGSIRRFCDEIGIAKRDGIVDIALLEHCVREDLNISTPRVMGVLRPLRVVIDNYPDECVEEMDAANHPKDPDMGSRKVSFSKTIFIEQDDFCEDPPPKFFRLSPGREVRLRNAYIIRCVSVIKDEESGDITEIHCTYDPDTKRGMPGASRKVKSTIHWVSEQDSLYAEIRLYDSLFTVPDPTNTADESGFLSTINPKSLETLKLCRVERSLKDASPGDHFQFERQGYFVIDKVDSLPGTVVLNRTVTLRDTWAKKV